MSLPEKNLIFSCENDAILSMITILPFLVLRMVYTLTGKFTLVALRP